MTYQLVLVMSFLYKVNVCKRVQKICSKEKTSPAESNVESTSVEMLLTFKMLYMKYSIAYGNSLDYE